MILSIDVGGTFTDFVVLDESLNHFKVPSTPKNPEKAVKKGIENHQYNKEDTEIFHGTTISTNAFLEREGVETAFITNKGFEELIYKGRQTRPELYTLNFEKLKPPVKKENCYGINCRMDEDGNELRAIEKKELKKLAKELAKENKSVAVCLLHSFVNDEHEKEIAEELEKHGINYSLSSEVSSEFREYERSITTLLDAYLSPIIKEYMERVTKILGIEPFVMKSGGGLEKAKSVKSIDTIYSGPAGGVAGAKYISGSTNKQNLITFDMGGTSADMATITDGGINWKPNGQINGFPLQAKMIDIETIGSGGGSIAWIEKGGALKVGPQSSGAEPGPVCYGRGGKKPTVTDALLHLGYIDPSYFLGGEIELEYEESKKSLKKLSKNLGLEFQETILGIFKIVNSKMARVMKKITVEKGLNPSDFSILAFGGAGPLHAASLAEKLDIKEVIVPPLPGVFSALGMVTGDLMEDNSKTLLCSLDNKNKLKKEIKKLKNQTELSGSIKTYLGLRYMGQSHHIDIELKKWGNIAEKFHKRHRELFGFSNNDTEIEVVRVHVETKNKRKVSKLNVQKNEYKEPKTQKCIFKEGNKETKIYKRKQLPIGFQREGPAIIADKTSTTLVPPDWSFQIKESNLIKINNEE